jgi:hypothetical protein
MRAKIESLIQRSLTELSRTEVRVISCESWSLGVPSKYLQPLNTQDINIRHSYMYVLSAKYSGQPHISGH